MALGVAVIESDGSNFLSSADRPPRSQMNYQQSTHSWFSLNAKNMDDLLLTQIIGYVTED